MTIDPKASAGADAAADSAAGRQARSAIVQDLVVECFARIERDGEPAIEAFCAEHPEHAEQLRRRLRALGEMGLLATAIGKKKQSFPERLGDFRLIRTLGSGGMGVVYLAEQESLRREVALKLIRPENLYFPGARQRFQREVEAVARLQHPGIVPVYTVGEEAGIPYFAMERVDGCTLEDVFRDLRKRRPQDLSGEDLGRACGAGGPVFGASWLEACFRLTIQVADALAHAHERGIVHRDIKPTNVMITRAGRTLLLDFGLASSHGATKMTRTGALVGSVPYMAPEQLAGGGAHVDQRTDVYALGITLYELLTLQSPYLSTDVEVTRRRILAGDAPPVRTLNPAVPWDAETVCLTAIDRDPERRYATVQDFARDLKNVLELRPIAARRPSAALRLKRFCQRHPASCVAVALGFFMVVIGPLVLAWRQHVANVEIQRALGEARDERALAEERFGAALAAVNQMLVRVGDDRLKDVPQAEQVRRELLEDALLFYQRLARDRRGDLKLTSEMGDSLRKLGTLETKLGRYDEAKRSYAQALELLEIGRPREALPEYRHQLASTLNDLGILLWTSGALGDAEARLAEAAEIDEQLMKDHAGRIGPRRDLADLYSNLGGVQAAQGDFEAAEESFRHAVDVGEQLAEASHGDPHFKEQVAASLVNLGSSIANSGRVDESEEPFRQALAVLDELRAHAPGSADLRQLRATAQRALATAIEHREARDEAEALYQSADEILAGLARDFPTRPDYVTERAHNLVDLAEMLKKMAGRVPDSRARFQDAIQILERVERAYPTYAEAAPSLGLAQLELGVLLAEQGDPAGAEHALRFAVDRYRQLSTAAPEAVDHHYRVALAARALAVLEPSTLSPDERRRLAKDAVDQAHAASRAVPTSEAYRECVEQCEAALERLGEN